MAEFLREAVGVEGRELSEELALNSSELRLSEASLRPLLMELLSSQLPGQRQCWTPLPSPGAASDTPAQPQPCHPCNFPASGAARAQTSAPGSAHSWLQPSLAQAGALPAHKPP